MLDGLSNYLVFELKKTVLFISSTWSCKHHMPSPTAWGVLNTSLSPLKHLISVCCALHRESRSCPTFPNQTSLPGELHSLSESVGNWHSPFGRTILLLARQITVSWSLWVAREGDVPRHVGMLAAMPKSKLWPEVPGTLCCTPWQLALNSLGEISRQLSDCAYLSKPWPCFCQQLKVIIPWPLPAHRTCCARLQVDKHHAQLHTAHSVKEPGPHNCPPGLLWYQLFPTHTAMHTSDLPEQKLRPCDFRICVFFIYL